MVVVAHANVVGILTRAPSAGGKRRLFAALGRPPDRTLLEALLLDTIDGAARSGAHIIVAVTPPEAQDDIEQLVIRLKTEATADLPARRDIEVIAQPDGDLGERMRATMAQLFEAGAQRVALIGSDLPEIDPSAIRDAFQYLDEDPAAVVLGPAKDGGYYLVAAAAVPPIFDGIKWGTAEVLAQTRAAAATAGLRVHLVSTLNDVDRPEDLQRLTDPASRTVRWARTNGLTGPP